MKEWKTGYIPVSPFSGRRLERAIGQANSLGVNVSRIIAFNTSHAWAMRCFKKEWYALDSADYLQEPHLTNPLEPPTKIGFVFILENLTDL